MENSTTRNSWRNLPRTLELLHQYEYSNRHDPRPDRCRRGHRRAHPGGRQRADDAIRALEELKAITAAAQARITAEFLTSQQTAAKTRAQERKKAAVDHDFEAFRALKDAERAIAAAPAQIALARRVSPFQGRAAATLAVELTTDLPGTYAALRAGWLSEWRATIVARVTRHLSPQLRREADARLCADPHLPRLGDRALAAQISAIVYDLDAEAAVARSRAAENERRVTCRPKPDTMLSLNALLPMKDGVAVYAALEHAAVRARAEGDPRSRAQVIADTLVERVTGRTATDPVPVHLQVVLSDATLTGVCDAPGAVPGYGPVPAGWIRDLLTDPATPVWLRRLWAVPATGSLVAMETRGRTFTPTQREFLRLRDGGTCRTPWCDAPIRHADHVRPSAEDGPTAIGNGQGLCEDCNYRRSAPGWTSRVVRGPDHTVRTTTPTGHGYDSTAPPVLPANPRDGADYSWPEHVLFELIS